MVYDIELKLLCNSFVTLLGSHPFHIRQFEVHPAPSSGNIGNTSFPGWKKILWSRKWSLIEETLCCRTPLGSLDRQLAKTKPTPLIADFTMTSFPARKKPWLIDYLGNVAWLSKSKIIYHSHTGSRSRHKLRTPPHSGDTINTFYQVSQVFIVVKWNTSRVHESDERNICCFMRVIHANRKIYKLIGPKLFKLIICVQVWVLMIQVQAHRCTAWRTDAAHWWIVDRTHIVSSAAGAHQWWRHRRIASGSLSHSLQAEHPWTLAVSRDRSC